jgi:hypothetical protein
VNLFGSAERRLNDIRNVSDCGAYLGMARDHWVEYLRCPRCRKTGVALASTEDDLSWTVQIDSVPAGFKVIRSGDVSNFYCSTCERPVEP